VRSDTEIYALFADADPVGAPLDTSALTLRIEGALGHGLATPVTEPTRKETTMVTHQQPDIEIPTTTSPRQRSRGPLVAFAAAVVVIVVGVGIAFATGVFESGADAAAERLAVATETVDAWGAAWEATDGAAAAALFTEDGVYRDPGIGTIRGRDAIMRDVNTRGVGTSRYLRTGDLVATDDGTFIYPMQFNFDGETWAGEVEVQLEGNLIARGEWLYWDELKE
jgi:hypothetical protein